MKLISGIALGLSVSVIAGTSIAQGSFDLVDENNDDRISKDEFYGTIGDNGIYADWDINRNGLIDGNEFEKMGNDEDFDDYDANRDENLNANELYDGMFGAFDENEDGHWDGDEWDDAGDDGWFDI